MTPRTPRRTHRQAIARLVAVALLVDATAAWAQSGPDSDASGRAETLYDEAVRLMSAGRDAEACPLLTESQALDPALGTLLALARCQEKTGKLASAWSAYLDVAARAARAGQVDRQAAARRQAAALEDRLPKLTIELGPAVSGLPGLRIVRDGSEVGSAIAGTAVPVDPGEHVVELHAEGRIPARARVVIAEREARRIVFDDLERAIPGRAARAAPPRVEVVSEGGGGLASTQVAGVVLVGGGAATLGAASVLGVLAAGANDDSIAACAPFEAGRGGSAEAYGECTSSRADAGGLADASTVVFVAGAALASAGVVLVVLGGDDEPGSEVDLAVGPGAGGVAAWGAF